eukprot:TRINITY_DN4906_c0_g1_i4.p1 TRINITY_DN4906_c0_g1~~TRINITY_DN4906_c0_g1_i4.p1  ORF type:complete len:257 (+),score=89.26 TRINITY_DN4906_c0_g1_i4:145-915(+)
MEINTNKADERIDGSREPVRGTANPGGEKKARMSPEEIKEEDFTRTIEINRDQEITAKMKKIRQDEELQLKRLLVNAIPSERELRDNEENSKRPEEKFDNKENDERKDNELKLRHDGNMGNNGERNAASCFGEASKILNGNCEFVESLVLIKPEATEQKEETKGTTRTIHVLHDRGEPEEMKRTTLIRRDEKEDFDPEKSMQIRRDEEEVEEEEIEEEATLTMEQIELMKRTMLIRRDEQEDDLDKSMLIRRDEDE